MTVIPETERDYFEDEHSITEIAKSVGDVSTDERGRVTIEFDPQGLLAFEQAILAKRDESVRLLLVQLDDAAKIVTRLMQRSVIQNEEIESLKVQLAMQADVLKEVDEYLTPRVAVNGIVGRTVVLPKVKQALNATAEDVAKYKAEQKVEWENDIFGKVIRVYASDREARLVFANIPEVDVLTDIALRVKERGGVR